MRKYRGRARFVRSTEKTSPETRSAAFAKQFEMAATEDFPAKVPFQFRTLPPLTDDLMTQTSEAQEKTLEECLPLLRAAGDPTRNPFDFNEFGLPELRSEDHIDFLHENLSQFPSAFVGLDASRPWLIYWGLMGLYFLGEDVTPMRRQ